MYEIQGFSRDGVQLLIQVLGKPITEGVGRGSGYPICLFALILHVQLKKFLSCRDECSWDEPVLRLRIKCLARTTCPLSGSGMILIQQACAGLNIETLPTVNCKSTFSMNLRSVPFSRVPLLSVRYNRYFSLLST